MIILGVDPGLGVTGFALLKKNDRTTSLIDYGYVRLAPSQTIAVRIGMFYDFFNQKIIQYKVTHIALETPFLGKNSQSFLKLGYLRGILYLLGNMHSLSIHDFSPCQIKQMVTGFGGASKEQVARVVLQLFPTLRQPEKFDVTDALAISLCGLWHHKQNSFLSK